MKAFELFSVILKYGIDTKVDSSIIFPMRYNQEIAEDHIKRNWDIIEGNLKHGHEYISVASYPDGTQRFLFCKPDAILSNKHAKGVLYHLYEIE